MKKVIDKSDSRGHSLYDWLDSHHTFSFDEYYNPRRMNFGALRVLNDDRVAPGKGFGTHPHKNMEIISIPLKGKLKHGDNHQNSRIIIPGDIQTMSAGTGIYHSEMYNPQIQISAESETKRSIFREKDKTKRSKKESAQHSKSRNKSFVMTSVSAL